MGVAFPKPLIVKHLDGRMWELMRSFEYHTEVGEIIEVPKGFTFDFASIPRPFWSIIGPPTGRYGPAALIHDFLCVLEPIDYRYADRIFYEAMRDCGVAYLKRTLMYWAVRLWHLKDTTG